MKNLLLALVAGLAVVSCAPNTPQARIEKSPEKFAALNQRDRELVERGELRRGMSRDAVWLAWGAPGQSYQGSKKGKQVERWDYIGSRPVYSSWIGGGWGYGSYGYGFGRYGYSALGVGFGPDVTYLPYRVASVWFENQQLDAWERLR